MLVQATAATATTIPIFLFMILFPSLAGRGAGLRSYWATIRGRGAAAGRAAGALAYFLRRSSLSRSRSRTTFDVRLKTIWLRFWSSKAGQFGMAELFGFPERANATHVGLI